ncbi:hypothetical protein BKA25_002537 [Actinoalloteichus hymeniacidonis]|nr:hypothetical protein [Actinoalloteichus hymeniacidonis]
MTGLLWLAGNPTSHRFAGHLLGADHPTKPFFE